MKLQKATRFGLYATLELAANAGEQLSAGDIAEKYAVSINHLAKVLRTLGRARVIESVRGAGGGYRFAGNARRMTLLNIIELFEDIGPPAPEIEDPGEETGVGRALQDVLVEIDEISRATLGSITIETFLNMARRLKRPGEAGGVRAAE